MSYCIVYDFQSFSTYIPSTTNTTAPHAWQMDNLTPFGIAHAIIELDKLRVIREMEAWVYEETRVIISR